MNWKKITAIIHTERLECVEEKLRNIGVRGVTVTHVKGFGEYANFFRRDWMVRHVRLEIFIHQDRAEEIVNAIMEEAHTGTAGDGVIAVQPVDELYRIRNKAPADGNDV